MDTVYNSIRSTRVQCGRKQFEDRAALIQIYVRTSRPGQRVLQGATLLRGSNRGRLSLKPCRLDRLPNCLMGWRGWASNNDVARI